MKMKGKLLFHLVLFFFASSVFAQERTVYVQDDVNGMKLIANGKELVINGMNWDYIPRGENYTYSLWRQPEATIKACLLYTSPSPRDA